MSTDGGEQRPLTSLVRHTVIYGSGYVTMAIASFVLVPVYTRYLPPSAYGLLGLMLVLYGVMKQVYDFGFTNSVGRFFFDSDEEGGETQLLRMRATATTFLVLFGGGLTLILWIYAPTWSRLLTQSAAHGNLVRTVAVTLYAESVGIVPLTLMRMRGRSRLFVVITLVRFVLTLGLSMTFVIGLRMGVQGALLSNACSAFAVLVILSPEYVEVIRGRPSWALLREMLSFGVPFFPVLLSSWFIDASDRYLLGIYRNHTEVGYYVLGYKVAQIMQIAVAAFSMGWAPLRFAIYRRADAQEVYSRLTSAYVIAASIVTVAVSVFAREIVAVIAPRSYSPAAIIVPLITLSYALNGLYVLMLTGMGVVKRTAPMLWIVGGAAAANIGVNLVLIPLWGMRAAAVTTVMANLIMVGGSWYFSQRCYPIAYDWRRITRAAGLGAAVVAAVVWLAPRGGLAGVLTGLVGLAAFGLLLIASRTLSRSDLAFVRERVGGLRLVLRRSRPPELVR